MKICESNRCTACAACVNSCPKGCISLICDELGRLTYRINEDICVSCGRCTAVCPQVNAVSTHAPITCYAAYNECEEVRKRSSSGGAAAAFYRQALASGYGIVGAAFEDGVCSLKMTDKEECLPGFLGSKYVYADPGKVYQAVEHSLKAGKGVLFIGLPCQVAGLRGYLAADYDKLVTVDLVCHGTPPAEYLRERLAQYGSKVDSVSFRQGTRFLLSGYDRDGNEIFSEKDSVDPYLLSFIRWAILSESCYVCRFAQEARVSDMTLGDFWGIGAKCAYDGPTEHISLVIVNTPKGEVFLKGNRELILEERSIKEAIQGNKQLTCPSRKPELREEFVRLYPKHGFEYAVRKSGLGKEIRKNRILITLSGLKAKFKFNR